MEIFERLDVLAHPRDCDGVVEDNPRQLEQPSSFAFRDCRGFCVPGSRPKASSSISRVMTGGSVTSQYNVGREEGRVADSASAVVPVPCRCGRIPHRLLAGDRRVLVDPTVAWQRQPELAVPLSRLGVVGEPLTNAENCDQPPM